MAKIRRFDPRRDLLEIADMTNKLLDEEYKLAMFTNVHDSWPDGFLVSESFGNYHGTIITIVTEPSTARILVLAVNTAFRRRGIGSDLLKVFIKKAVLRGIERLTLEVRITNISAIEFYKKHHFQIVSSIPLYYKDGEDAYVMERCL